MELLESRQITKRFGGLTAVNELNFNIKQGQIVGLVGPNGSGSRPGSTWPPAFSLPLRGRCCSRAAPSRISSRIRLPGWEW